MPAGTEPYSNPLACASLPLPAFTREALAASAPADCRRSSSPGAAPRPVSRRARPDNRWPCPWLYSEKVQQNGLNPSKASGQTICPAFNIQPGIEYGWLWLCVFRASIAPLPASAHRLLGVVIVTSGDGMPLPCPNAATAYLTAQRTAGVDAIVHTGRPLHATCPPAHLPGRPPARLPAHLAFAACAGRF